MQLFKCNILFYYKYFNDCLKYMDITENEFFETIEKFRPAHLWTKVGNEWKLKNPVWK